MESVAIPHRPTSWRLQASLKSVRLRHYAVPQASTIPNVRVAVRTTLTLSHAGTILAKRCWTKYFISRFAKRLIRYLAEHILGRNLSSSILIGWRSRWNAIFSRTYGVLYDINVRAIIPSALWLLHLLALASWLFLRWQHPACNYPWSNQKRYYDSQDAKLYILHLEALKGICHISETRDKDVVNPFTALYDEFHHQQHRTASCHQQSSEVNLLEKS